MTRRRPLGHVALAALVLALGAGCSDDDDSGAEPDVPAVLDFEGDPDSQFCELLREVQVQDAFERPPETAADVEAGYTQMIFVLARAAEHAPEELQTEVGLVLEGVVAFDGALRAVGYSFDALEQSPDAAEIAAAVNDPSFRVAGERIEAYKTQVCGL